MHVAHLSLADFRSYARVEVPLDPGVTAFVGPNGQGKTNLVEAIGYIATLGSHRVATDAPLVRLGAERAVVRASVVAQGGRTTLVELEITPGKANRARLNRSDNVRPRDVLGVLRTVLFAPEDLSLVKGDPGERRRFLDELLTARAPRLAGVRSDYERVLKQRNALLKTAATARRAGGGKAADLATLEVWDGHLARTGAELTAFRIQLVAALQPLVAEAYRQLAPGGGETVLEYRSSFEGELPTSREQAEQQLLDALQAARAQEVARGLTLVGPHRDELLLRLGPLPAKGYASHGESWSYALALRLASYELLRAEGGEPVLILDDVFAELDARRRDRLAELVAGGEQVLVTAAVAEDVPKALSGARYAVSDGAVTRLTP
ncbi:DNA replication/repair protein RecF [Kitasatospora griseola]|uniref:DNA replication/repair protein RecF n=1 Tax=Kitasatospora griseola TaxID=2064 RepID=UPI001670C7F0|nr:DNA replication/repair protein RecF [Kitasatospora griseola]GGQ71157.1 DNA replication and repair protein RecF [Kitasatospora griseola]